MKRTLVIALALAFAFPGLARAQTSALGSVQLTVSDLLSVAITANASQSLSPGQTEFDAGFIDAADITVETKGNVAHDLVIKGNAPSWTYVGGAAPAPVKPVGHLGFRLDGSAGAHLPLSETDQPLVSGLAAGTNTTDVDLRATLNYAADKAGTYTLAYTVTVNPAP